VQGHLQGGKQEGWQPPSKKDCKLCSQPQGFVLWPTMWGLEALNSESATEAKVMHEGLDQEGATEAKVSPKCREVQDCSAHIDWSAAMIQQQHMSNTECDIDLDCNTVHPMHGPYTK